MTRWRCRRLKEAAEKAKIELSSASQTEVKPAVHPMAPATGSRCTMVASSPAPKLESLVGDLIKKVDRAACKAALKDAGLSPRHRRGGACRRQ